LNVLIIFLVHRN